MTKKILLGFFIITSCISVKALYDDGSFASFMYFVFNILMVLYFALKIKEENG